MRKKRKQSQVAVACQLRGGSAHPFVDLRGFVPLGMGEERIYRQLREAIPVLDAAVASMWPAPMPRPSGGWRSF